MDKKISFILYNFIKNKKSIYKFFIKFTNASKLFFFIVYFLILLYLLISHNNKLKSFSLSVLLLIFFNNLLKYIFKRKRPFTKSNTYSFPSNHAASSMVIAISSFNINHILGYILILFSIITGLIRVFLGVHYLSDIIIGFLFGFFISFITFKIF